MIFEMIFIHERSLSEALYEGQYCKIGNSYFAIFRDRFREKGFERRSFRI